jgi:hypothetical protein
MIVSTSMNARMVNDTIEELNSERKLCLKKGELGRASVLLGAINRIYAELQRERHRATADPATRAA